MDEARDGVYRDPRGTEFLKLLPVVKLTIDAMTSDNIHERWSDGSDRRTVNSERLDFEAFAALKLVQKAGFGIDPLEQETVELIRCIFAFTGQKMLSPSAVLKRLQPWKTPGKQNVYAFHEE
jgi:hypothetical protein